MRPASILPGNRLGKAGVREGTRVSIHGSHTECGTEPQGKNPNRVIQ